VTGPDTPSEGEESGESAADASPAGDAADPRDPVEPDHTGEPSDDAVAEAGDDEAPATPSVPRKPQVPLPPSQLRAIQDALAAMNRLPADEMRRVLSTMPDLNRTYTDIARIAARSLPPLEVRVRLPRVAIDAAALQLNRDLSERLAQVSRELSAAAAHSLEPQFRRLAEQMQQALRIDPDLLARLLEESERRVPENVRGMRVTDMFTLVFLALTHRLGVFYALRPDRIREVLSAEDDPEAVDAVLDDFGEDDWVHVEGVLGKVMESGDRLAGLATLLMEAVSALRAGLPAASQALSTAVWDTEITHAAGPGGKAITYAKGRALGRDELLDEGLYELFESGVYAPLAEAYKTPNDSPLYSRNGTVHGAQPAQFGKCNAVRALTIAVGLVAWRAMHARQ
jgi:hypothetical protein